MSKTLFCHFDIEADGSDVLYSNMISIGVCFTDHTGKEIDSFLGDLKPIAGHQPEKVTMDWWNSNEHNRKELERIRSNARDANEVMRDLSNKLADLFSKGQYRYSVWIAKPISFDWQWLNCYYNRFLRTLTLEQQSNTPKLHFRGTCMSTMRDTWQAIHKLSKREVKAKLEEAAKGLEITHNPLDDCRCQAKQYFWLCKELGIAQL